MVLVRDAVAPGPRGGEGPQTVLEGDPPENARDYSAVGPQAICLGSLLREMVVAASGARFWVKQCGAKHTGDHGHAEHQRGVVAINHADQCGTGTIPR